MENTVVFNEHAAFMNELARGIPVACSDELYDQFLNVLPPVSMGSGYFLFGEGDTRIRFWKTNGQCFARYTRTTVASADYEHWIGVVLQNQGDTSVYRVTETCRVNIAVGATFPDLETAAHELGLQLR